MIEPDPNATFPIVLTQHKPLPPDRQPRLYFRPLRRQQSKQAISLMQRAEAMSRRTTAEQGLQLMLDIEAFILGNLAGWDNQVDEQGQPLPYCRDTAAGDLDRILEDADLMELVSAIPGASQLAAIDRKKSASQSLSSSERAASTALPANPRDAGTSRPPESPSN